VWAEQWQYRANLLMYLLYWLVSPGVFLVVWTTVATTQGTVKDLTIEDPPVEDVIERAFQA